MKPPFFLIGAPRSGTTFLQKALHRHPQLFVTNETHAMRQASRMLQGVPADPRRLTRHSKEFQQRLREALPALLDGIYVQMGAPVDGRWGDKNPRYADPAVDEHCLVTIDTLYPGSSFIHIIRDGRSVVASLLDRGWADLDRAIAAWVRVVRHARDFGDRVGPARYREVRYEDLVADGERVTSELLVFLDVRDASKVHNFLRRQQLVRTPYSRPTSPPGAIGKQTWQQRLDDDQVAAIRAGAGDLLHELGYERSRAD